MFYRLLAPDHSSYKGPHSPQQPPSPSSPSGTSNPSSSSRQCLSGLSCLLHGAVPQCPSAAVASCCRELTVSSVEKRHSAATWPTTQATLHCNLHCTVHCALHCTFEYCTALYCTALHCTAPHCTTLGHSSQSPASPRLLLRMRGGCSHVVERAVSEITTTFSTG